jgi:hypothetical protein
MSGRREALLKPVDYTILDTDHAEIVGDVWGGQPTGWLRIGDRIVMIDADETLLHEALWRITDLEAEQAVAPSGRYNRTRITFLCRRVGWIRDQSALEALR